MPSILVTRSLQNVPRSTSMSVVLFLSRKRKRARSCLCFSSLLKFHKKNPMSVVLFSFQKLRTTRTCLCFFPLLQINSTPINVCCAIFFPKFSNDRSMSVFLCSRLHTSTRCLWCSSLLRNLGLCGHSASIQMRMYPFHGRAPK